MPYPSKVQSRTWVETGEVVKVLPQNRIKVKVKKHSACDQCEHKKYCDPFGKEHFLIEAQNDVQAIKGQKVQIEVALVKPSSALLFLYIVPLFFLLLGAVLGNFFDPLDNKDASSAITSLTFVVLSFLGLRIYTKKSEAKTPRIKVTKIVDQDNSPSYT